MTEIKQQAGRKFGAARKFFHWIIALFLLLQIPLGLYMTDLPLGPDKLEKYSLHKAIGMLIFILAISRLAWAAISQRPPLPVTTPLYEKALVKGLQAILYIIVCLMPLSGWMMSSAAGYPVNLFGLLTLPGLIEPNKELVEGFIQMHEMQSWILFGAIGLHFIGALRHHFLLKDDILNSMLPSKTK
ncbi:MAG: cytochrome b [Gammaproteobacteria bacterium]|jgi:cytochrome b561|nr:cytochrome b [Gammaproteobacteria bacterium]